MKTIDCKTHIAGLTQATLGEYLPKEVWVRTHKFKIGSRTKITGRDEILALLPNNLINKGNIIRQYLYGTLTEKILVAIIVTDPADSKILDCIFANIDLPNW